MKQSAFASFICGATSSEQLLQTELHQDKQNQVLNPSPKSRKHWSELNNGTGCIPMKQSVFADSYFASNSEQLSQTELSQAGEIKKWQKPSPIAT